MRPSCSGHSELRDGSEEAIRKEAQRNKRVVSREEEGRGMGNQVRMSRCPEYSLLETQEERRQKM